MPTTSRTAARRLLLRRLLTDSNVCTQAEMVAALGRAGHTVTQTTVSRDLAAISARKGQDDRYHLPPSVQPAGMIELADRLRQFVVEIAASANIVVLHTPPGSAHAVAVAVDGARESGQLATVLGTVAGDDTVLVVTRAAVGGAPLRRRLERIMES